MSASSHRWGSGLKFAALAASLSFTLTTPLASRAQLGPPAPAPTQATSYAAAFTPGQALPLVLDTIRGARSTLLVAAYSFTSRPVATALRDAQRRGVKVFVVVDAGEAAKAYSAARFLANERVPVRANARHALQHNKFIVADGTAVQTGSFNYTASAAQRNAENVLVVRNAPALAAQYGAEWRRLWDEGAELPPAY
ncbi:MULTISPECIES: phospholipase D family protein [unclassified Variovorax]|uniref:phospholipase D family nuclease n=1 Tax=unclassified Variovorax TaxID=663243 RepID=UPI000838C48D|nr:MULTISPECIES: phospholipase D family protein [unclassified Variovorax]PNG46144.1 Phospholipase D [Variovorax sp. B2]PNG46197.1 Phospholipase D [Variovorax sp. B4]VTV19271.1 Phospholipase D precursor [Variovorax sp. WDL1]